VSNRQRRVTMQTEPALFLRSRLVANHASFCKRLCTGPWFFGGLLQRATWRTCIDCHGRNRSLEAQLGRHPADETKQMKGYLYRIVSKCMGGAAKGWTTVTVEAIADLSKNYPVLCEDAKQQFFTLMAPESACVLLAPPHDLCTSCKHGKGHYKLRLRKPKCCTLYLSSQLALPALHFSKTCRKCNRRFYYDKEMKQHWVRAAPDEAAEEREEEECAREDTELAEEDEVPSDEEERAVEDDDDDDDDDNAEPADPSWRGRFHLYYPGLREYSLTKSGRYGITTTMAHDMVISLSKQ
jgi:hypothetical protein